MPTSDLTPEQAERADRIYQALRQAVEEDLRNVAALLASKPDNKLLGPTEFEVRDRVLKIGAKAIETALEERKKGGTTVPVRPARIATRTPASSPTAPRGWSACWGRSARSGPTITASTAVRATARPTRRWGWPPGT